MEPNAPETAEARDSRLCRRRQRDRDQHRTARSRYRARRLAQSTEDRDSVLQQRTDTLRSESEHERARLQSQQRAVQFQTPHFEQLSVQAKMAKFHSRLTTLEVPKCATCLKSFPGLNMKSVATDAAQQCVRCYRDNHIPKMYSSANNMIPGLVPPELQVSVQPSYMYVTLTCTYITDECIYRLFMYLMAKGA